MNALTSTLHRLLAALPPPPRPDGTSAGDAGSSTVPWVVGLAVASVVVFGLGMVVGHALGVRRARALSKVVLYRIELWRNGEAELLGYIDADGGGAAALDAHLAALRAKRVRGAVVLIEPVADAIVALKPLATEEPPWTRPIARGWSPVPRPIAATN